VFTNLTEQISRRFPGDSRRDLKRNPGHVCIASACYEMYRIYWSMWWWAPTNTHHCAIQLTTTLAIF